MMDRDRFYTTVRAGDVKRTLATTYANVRSYRACGEVVRVGGTEGEMLTNIKA